MASKSITRTEIFPSLITADTATFAFEYLRDTIKWESGIKSRKGFTRLAKSLDVTEDEVVYSLINSALKGMSKGKNKLRSLAIYGLYLNYYKDGSMWTPNHSHPGTTQIIISLGATRTLNIAKKSYQMTNGDVAIFGGSIHGVPKDETTDGRISIAIFAKMI
jgi:hypothetical protein